MRVRGFEAAVAGPACQSGNQYHTLQYAAMCEMKPGHMQVKSPFESESYTLLELKLSYSFVNEIYIFLEVGVDSKEF
jgi:hypothetical protein